MPSNQQTQADKVWSSLDQETQQNVVDEFHRVVKEMIDDNFRISSITPPEPTRRDLRAAVEPTPSYHEQGEPAHAVRAA